LAALKAEELDLAIIFDWGDGGLRSAVASGLATPRALAS
jgi:hypothetical protein